MTYLITFTCYGSHVHGDESGSVDRNHNVPGHRLVESDVKRAWRERALMDQVPFMLNASDRCAVLSSLREVCAYRTPEKVMNDFKAYASRRLNETVPEGQNRKRWTRHGSTRWLPNREDIVAAVRYVVDGQGVPMAVFEVEA